MQHVKVNGQDYAYQLTGAGPNPALVLLHGFTGCAASWDHLLARLAAERLVLAVDLPGHGETCAPGSAARASMPAAAEDLAALIKAVLAETVLPVDVLGYSMGGRLALYFAVHYPDLVGRLVLESASPGLADPAAREARKLADEDLASRIEGRGIPAFVDEWERLPLFASQSGLPAAQRDALRRRRLANTPQGLAGSLRGMGTGVQPSLWPRLVELHCPVLLIAGALDEKFSTINRQMHKVIGDSRLEILPGAGHTPHLEIPEAYLDCVLEFLS